MVAVMIFSVCGSMQQCTRHNLVIDSPNAMFDLESAEGRGRGREKGEFTPPPQPLFLFLTVTHPLGANYSLSSLPLPLKSKMAAIFRFENTEHLLAQITPALHTTVAEEKQSQFK